MQRFPAMLKRFIGENYESRKEKSKRAPWAKLKLECDQHGITVRVEVHFPALTEKREISELQAKLSL
jgi:hypothetical protein